MIVDYEPGDKLRNNALVMRYEASTGLALCFWSESPNHPYVVWNVDEFGHARSGSYFQELDEAIAEYDRRST